MSEPPKWRISKALGGGEERVRGEADEGVENRVRNFRRE